MPLSWSGIKADDWWFALGMTLSAKGAWHYGLNSMNETALWCWSVLDLAFYGDCKERSRSPTELW